MRELRNITSLNMELKSVKRQASDASLTGEVKGPYEWWKKLTTVEPPLLTATSM